MTRRILAAAVACALVSLWATPAHAGGCGDVTTIGTGEAGSNTVYVDVRPNDDYLVEVWIYLEANGVDDLQTGGPWPFDPDGIVPGFFDPCITYGREGPDTLIF